jgi:hypothetical protein
MTRNKTWPLETRAVRARRHCDLAVGPTRACRLRSAIYDNRTEAKVVTVR